MAPVLAPVAAVLEAGRVQGIAPALAAAVAAPGRLLHLSAHGRAGPRPLAATDRFDVASLTKVMATGTLCARLAAEGALPLDAPAARWLPGFRGDKAAVTLRHLLAHASGLPPWRPLHAAVPAGAAPAAAEAAVEAAIAAEPLLAPPGTRAAYSDLGFVALGIALSRLAGAPLERLCEERVLRPLGLGATSFAAGPGGRERARREGAAFVPTVVRETGEERLGEVHDENARALGGVAGHAGLFSTAADVAALGAAWIEALSGRSALLPAATAALFAAPDATPGSSRALAWDRPSGESPAIGSRLGRGSRGAIGHLAFTGCSLWLDLDRGLSCALLTNHCPRVGETAVIQAFRRRFHDAVAEGLGS